MKNLLLILIAIPSILFGQTKTSTTNGDFYNPLTWDCFCLPASGDNVVINHDLTMNTSIYYTAGTITINASGSLSENGGDKDIWIDGSARFINHGDVSVRYFVSSNWTYTDNTGNFNNIDSMLIQGVMNNSGSINVYDFLNDQTANFGNFGLITVQNNMNNQGNFDNYKDINVGNDFSNCNTQSLNAEFTNYNGVCIARDFLNCNGDELNGTGKFYVGRNASNLGLFSETFTFYTNPPGLFYNPGTVENGVTITTGTCTLEVAENEDISFQLYPNPTTQTIYTSEQQGSFIITDAKGQIVLNGEINQFGIDVSHLTNGVYLFQIKDKGVTRFVKY